MEFTNIELEIMISGIRKERELAEQDFIKSIQVAQKQHNEGEYIVLGVAETLQMLQKFNALLDKLENELMTRKRF